LKVATAKPKRRASYHHGDLQHALVQAALELVSGQSPETLTLREVTRRVGVNHRAAYRHFKDRLSLFAAVAEQGYVDLLATLRASLAPTPRAPPESRVRALGLAYVAFAVDRPSHYRIMFGRRLNEDGRFPQLEALSQEAFALISGEVAAGQLHGAFGDWPLREAVFSFWALTHGFCDLMLTRRIRVKRTLLDEYANRIVAPFVEGLKAKGPPVE
jgi:AcrR family transcriptional regulator